MNPEGALHEQTLDQYVLEWMRDERSACLAVLGDTGLGKSTFAERLYGAIALSGASALLVRVRDVHQAGSITHCVAEKTIESKAVDLLILDGLDELSTIVNRERATEELSELLSSKLAHRILVTSRTQYFDSQAQEEQHLASRWTRLGEALQPVAFDRVHIAPFEEGQIREYIESSCGALEAESLEHEILGNSQLTELARRPMLLQMLVEYLPAMRPSEPVNISRASLYGFATEHWQDREKGKFSDPEWHRLRQDTIDLMEVLAFRKIGYSNLDFSLQELRRFAETRELGETDGLFDAEALDADLKKSTFLRRDEDVFCFSHRSFWEYFAARALIRRAAAGDLHEGQWIADEIVEFAAELAVEGYQSAQQSRTSEKRYLKLPGGSGIWMLLVPPGITLHREPGKPCEVKFVPGFWIAETTLAESKRGVRIPKLFDADEARQVARGLGGRLPRVEEWQRAAVGEIPTRWPWGNAREIERLNCRESGIGRMTGVHAYAQGRSAFGCYNMSGNAWEWVNDGSSQLGGDFATPIDGCQVPAVLSGYSPRGHDPVVAEAAVRIVVPTDHELDLQIELGYE